MLGVGYLHYRNEGRSNADFKCSSGAFAGNMDFGIEYKLTDHLAVNGGFSILTGDFKKIKATVDDKKKHYALINWTESMCDVLIFS
ncbi:hypothetical protein NXV35_06290 [Bacteroides faecis]|nr:hypothetical protein [Bacteroides faecis]